MYGPPYAQGRNSRVPVSGQLAAGPSSRPGMRGRLSDAPRAGPSQHPFYPGNQASPYAHRPWNPPGPDLPARPSVQGYGSGHPSWNQGRPSRDHLRGGAPSYSARDGPVIYHTASKSFYPDAHHLLGLSGRDDDDDVRRSGSRMSAASIRSTATSAARKSTVSRYTSPPAGRYHFRNGVLVRIPDHEDSDDADVPEVAGPIAAPSQVGRKSSKVAARKVSSNLDSTGEPAARMSALAPSSPPRPKKTMRKREVIVISSDSEEEDPQGDQAGFIAVSASYRVGIRLQIHKRIPFLVRNLRKSFVRTCKLRNVPVHPPKQPENPVKYTYRFRAPQDLFPGQVATESWSEYHELVMEWQCPFCNLLGRLNTEEMLCYHFARDHAEVQMTRAIENNVAQYTFHLPERTPEELSEDEEEEDIPDRHQVQDSSDHDELEYVDWPPKPPSPVPVSEPLNHSRGHASASPMQVDESDAIEIDSESSRTSTPAPTYNIALKHEYEEVVLHREPTPIAPRTGITETGQLVPPPEMNPLGPAAEPPLESCRPGGPRIYDLLNDLPLEPYGVLAWAIVDREEEIYELADVRDEDKVMMALWNRWIFLNRVKFVFHREGDMYRAGVQAFIDEYYVMIHRAAGWAALRSFLIILTANRFLRLHDVLKLLNYYDKLVKENSVAPATSDD